MLIECPRCTARYEVAETLLGPAGKSVRCAKCGNVWLARRPEQTGDDAPIQWPEAPVRARAAEAEAATADGADDPALAEYKAAQDDAGKPGFARFPEKAAEAETARPRVASAAVIGWLATVIALGAAGWGAYTYREAVMEAWPPSERVYLALGLRP